MGKLKLNKYKKLELEKIHLRDRLKNKGIIQAEKFSWDNTFRQYLEFYKELYEKN